MTTKESLALARKDLSTNSPSPALDAEVLLAFVMKKSREYILTHPGQALSIPQLNKYKSFITKREQGVPVAYITNHREFFGSSFYVDENVFIPRPSTETLAEEAIKLIKEKNVNSIADIGTGSGCIAIILAKEFPELKIFATDNSEEALKIAAKNARKNKTTNITFLRGSLLKPLESESLKLIVSNPPYLDSSWIKSYTKHEPPKALVSNQKGLYHLKNIIEQSNRHFGKNADLLLEIDPRQASSIKSYATQIFPKAEISIVKDLEGHDRVLKVIN